MPATCKCKEGCVTTKSSKKKNIPPAIIKQRMEVVEKRLSKLDEKVQKDRALFDKYSKMLETAVEDISKEDLESQLDEEQGEV